MLELQVFDDQPLILTRGELTKLLANDPVLWRLALMRGKQKQQAIGSIDRLLEAGVAIGDLLEDVTINAKALLQAELNLGR